MPPARPDRDAATLSKAVEAMEAGRLHRARDLAEQVIARNPQHAWALRLAGEIARRQGQHRKALDRFIDAARVDPSDLATLEAVISTAVAVDRLDLATQALELAVIAAPTDGSRHARLGVAYQKWGKLDEALGHLNLATTLAPEDPYGWLALSTLHLMKEDPGVLAAERALKLAPDLVDAMLVAATAHEKLGDPGAARQLRQRALDLRPDSPDVAYYTVDERRRSPGYQDLSGLAEAVADASVDPESRARGMLALAQLNADAGQLELAARFLREGNALWAQTLQRQGRGYDPVAIEGHITRLERLVDEGLGALRVPSELPVPIVIGGLPRSGKTLLERRLARRLGFPLIGERPVLEAAQRHLSAQLSGTSGQATDITPEVVELVRTQVRYEQVADVIDSAAAGFLTAGGNLELRFHLAVLLHPGAVLIVCERDARDLALANLLKLIPNTNAYTNRVDWLAHRIGIRERATELWELLLPGQVHRVAYERLVEDERSVLDELAAVLPAAAGASAEPSQRDGGDIEVRSPAADPPADLPLHGQHVGMWRRWAPYLPELADLPVTGGGSHGDAK